MKRINGANISGSEGQQVSRQFLVSELLSDCAETSPDQDMIDDEQRERSYEKHSRELSVPVEKE